MKPFFFRVNITLEGVFEATMGAIGVGSIGASAYAIKGAKAIDDIDSYADLMSPEDAKKYLEFLENGSTAGLTPEELVGIDKLDELLALEKVEWDDVVKISGSPTVGKVFTDNPFDEVGKLKPNIKYQTGEYNYIYETDVQGRIINWNTDNLQLTKRDSRLKYKSDIPGKI